MANKEILIVDDDLNIRLMLRTTLEGSGYSVREAAGAREAMETLDRSAPAAVVLDLRMPNIDGMAVLEYLNDRPPSRRPKVIVLSAHGTVELTVRAIRLGASDFLEKPVTPEDLRLSIAAALAEQHSSHQPKGK